MTKTRKYLILVDLLKINYNRKITEIEGKISSTTGFATTNALTAVEIKIPNISDLVKRTYHTAIEKTDYNLKISDIDIEAKYFSTSGNNKFTGKILDTRIKEKRLVDKSDISGFIDKSDLDKIATLADL